MILKSVELIVVIIGIVISVFTLIEIRKQTQVNAEQINVLKKNSEISNKLTIFREFYPKYAIKNIKKIASDTNVGVEFSITNYSDNPLAYDNTTIIKVYNCGTNKYINLGKMDLENIEKELRDNKYQSIAPGDTINNFKMSIKLTSNIIKEIEVTKANFVIIMYTFLRLENVEHFDSFATDVGLNLSDKFTVGSEELSLPINTKKVEFKIPIKWNGSALEISNFEGCTRN